MHSGPLSTGVRPAPPGNADWLQEVDAWSDLLAQCARNPSRKRVHALRSRTLRLAVAAEYCLPEPAQNPAADQAFRRWTKEARKLRRALQPVRDADVYLARLERLGDVLAKARLGDTLQQAPGGEGKLSRRSERERNKLESRLKQRRQAGIGKLGAAIEARGERLKRLGREMAGSLEAGIRSREPSTAPTALRIFAALAAEFPRLGSDNLHDYRKGLKPALYLAELSAAADPRSRRLAAAFRKMHRAAGEWHDWQLLAREAGRVVAGRARRDGLASVLETLAARALDRAIALIRRSEARLLKGSGSVHAPRPSALGV